MSAAVAFSFTLSPGLLAQFDGDSEQQPGVQQPGQQPEHELRGDAEDRDLTMQHGGHHAEELMGMAVENRQGERLGNVEDFVIDLDAEEVPYVVISTGGILGIGDTKKAVPPQALEFSPEEDTLILDMDEQRWEDAPGFDSEQLEQLGQAERGRDLYQFYGHEWRPGEARERGVFGAPGRPVDRVPGRETPPEPGVQEQPAPQQPGAQPPGTTQQPGAQAPNGTQQPGGPQEQPGTQEDHPEVAEERPEAIEEYTNLVLASDLIGKNIVNQEREQIGQVEDLLIDLQSGGVAYAIISLGEEAVFDFDIDETGDRFAVSPQSLRLTDPEEDVVMDIDRQAFQQPQEFAADQWTRPEREPGQVYRYGEQDQEEWRGIFGREHRDREDRDTERDYEDTDREYRDTERDQALMDARGGHHAEELMGMNVENLQGENLGSVEDLVVDFETGEVPYLIISAGDIVGIGGTERAVPPQAFRFSPEEEVLTLDIDEQRWEDAPEFDRDQLEQFGQVDRGRETYEHYGQDWRPGEARQRGVFGEPRRPDEPGVQDEPAYRDRDRVGSPPRGTLGQRQLPQSRPQPQPRTLPGDRQQPGPEQTEQQPQPGVQQPGQQEQPGLSEDRPMAREAYTSLALASDIIGTTVFDNQQQEIGQLDDLLVNLETGSLAFALISADEIDMEARFAVSPEVLSRSGPEGDLVANIDRQALEQAEAFAATEWMRPDREQQVFRYEEQHAEDWRGIFGREHREREGVQQDEYDVDGALRDQEQEQQYEQEQETPETTPGVN